MIIKKKLYCFIAIHLISIATILTMDSSVQVLPIRELQIPLPEHFNGIIITAKKNIALTLSLINFRRNKVVIKTPAPFSTEFDFSASNFFSISTDADLVCPIFSNNFSRFTVIIRGKTLSSLSINIPEKAFVIINGKTITTTIELAASARINTLFLTTKRLITINTSSSHKKHRRPLFLDLLFSSFRTKHYFF